jgi:hypothetical protein
MPVISGRHALAAQPDGDVIVRGTPLRLNKV